MLGHLLICGGCVALAVANQDARATTAPAETLVNLDVLLEGVPDALTAIRPRSSQDRAGLRLLELYAEARALEDRNQLREAIRKLEQAQKDAPDHPAILKRLARLSFALGQPDDALAYGRKLLEIDPNDTGTLAMLVALLIDRRNDPISAESLIKSVLAHPKLNPNSAQPLVARRHLGDIYFELLNQPEQAADTYAALVEGLDRPQAANLPEIDQRRILHEDPAGSYLRFGDALLRAKRPEAALRAFERGLSYDAEHAGLPAKKSAALLELGRPEEALATLEAYLKRQPSGREPYELLGKILGALKRSNEYLPRLEKAAADDPKNLSLQFAFVEELRRNDRAVEADVRLRSLINEQGDPQIYGVLTSTLIQDRKPRELLTLFLEGVKKSGVIDVIRPHIESLANDHALSEEVLEEAVELARRDEKALTRELRAIVAVVARGANVWEPLIQIDRIALKQHDTDENVLLLYDDLANNRQFDEAAQVLEDLFKRRPAMRDARLLVAYAGCLLEAGKLETALDAAREAARLDATAFEPGLITALCLARSNRSAEAIAGLEALIKQHPEDDRAEYRARFALSSIYTDMNDFTNGTAQLEALHAKDPDDARINNDLGYLYAEQGKNLEKAEKLVRQALVGVTPDSLGSYLDSLGWVQYKQGKIEEALESLQEAARQPGVSATVFDHLGDANFHLQRYEAAETAWKQAESIAAGGTPPDKKLDSIRKKLVELKALRSSGLSNRPKDP